MGIVEEVGAEVTSFTPGDRVVMPFNISCGTASCATRACTRSARRRRCASRACGAALFGYTKLYGAGAGRPGGVPARPVRQHAADQGAGRAAGRPLRLPLRRAADRLAGGRVRRRSRTAARVVVLGLGPIGDMACRVAHHRGYRVIGVDLVPERLERARARGVEVARPERARGRPRRRRCAR